MDVDVCVCVCVCTFQTIPKPKKVNCLSEKKSTCAFCIFLNAHLKYMRSKCSIHPPVAVSIAYGAILKKMSSCFPDNTMLACHYLGNWLPLLSD